MKKFIYSLLAFSTLIIALYALISFSVKPKNIVPNTYMAAIIDKHNRIEQLNRPKMIFAGGSNLAFGLNSEEIENEFSVPVVNLGLHAGLGLKFIINELKATIKSNDVVFISPEYFLSSDGIYELKKNTSGFYKEAKKYYSIDLRTEILSDLDNTRKNLKSPRNKEENIPKVNSGVEVYSREGFNSYGDVVSHLDKKPLAELSDKRMLSYTYWSGINELNDFYEYAKLKNVAVFFIYPNFPLSEFDKNIDVINKLSRDLSDNLKFDILNNPSDLVFPDSLFFDTVYHLTKTGREARTKRLIEIIKRSPNAQRKLSAIRV
jgi:hypothetical protein